MVVFEAQEAAIGAAFEEASINALEVKMVVINAPGVKTEAFTNALEVKMEAPDALSKSVTTN